MNSINFIVAGNKITFSGSTVPVSGGFSYDKCIFSFDSEWNGFSKTVIFSMGNEDEMCQPLTENYCNVPEQFLRKAGLMKVGVAGINASGTVITTNEAAVKIRRGANESEAIPIAVAVDMREEGGGVG